MLNKPDKNDKSNIGQSKEHKRNTNQINVMVKERKSASPQIGVSNKNSKRVSLKLPRPPSAVLGLVIH